MLWVRARRDFPACLGRSRSIRCHHDGVIHDLAAVGAECQGVFALFQKGGGKGVFVAGVSSAAVGGAAHAAVIGIGQPADFRAVDGCYDAPAAAGYGDGEVAPAGNGFLQVEFDGPGAGSLGEIPVFDFPAFADGEGEVGGHLLNPLAVARLAAELEFVRHAVGLADLPQQVRVVRGVPIDDAQVELVAADLDAVPGEGLCDGSLCLPCVKCVCAGAHVRQGEFTVGIGLHIEDIIARLIIYDACAVQRRAVVHAAAATPSASAAARITRSGVGAGSKVVGG